MTLKSEQDEFKAKQYSPGITVVEVITVVVAQLTAGVVEAVVVSRHEVTRIVLVESGRVVTLVVKVVASESVVIVANSVAVGVGTQDIERAARDRRDFRGE